LTIGGADLVVDGPPPPNAADFIVRGIRALWKGAVVQEAGTAEAIPIRDFEFPVKAPVEILVYRDQAIQRSWEAQGAQEDNDGAMVHVIVSPTSTTVVVDRLDSALASSIREILRALRCNPVVHRRAA